MTIASEIIRLQGAKSDIKTAIENKGVAVPSDITIDQYSIYIDAIQGLPPDNLCFTADAAGSTIQLTKVGNVTSVSLETSSDLTNWSAYTIGNTITLTNVGDKIYIRNTNTTSQRYSSSASYYKFVMTGAIRGSGNINYLFNKEPTDSLPSVQYLFYHLFDGCTALKTAPDLPATTNLTTCCYSYMFYGCSSLITAPELPATTLGYGSYAYMFQGCTSLIMLPKLPAVRLTDLAYSNMFYGCSNIKISQTKTGNYQTEYRIPVSGTGSEGTNSLNKMFYGSGGTFAGTPAKNSTYYTSNILV